MTKQLSFLIVLVLAIFCSCKKQNSFTAVKVIYYVQIADSNTVNITCNSDYYFDSGNRKTISYTSNGGIWVTSHIAYKQEDYYIKVDYINQLKTENNFRVKVIFNDTLVKDSAVYDKVVTPIELGGTVTN